jgi:hypothetical protein
MPTRIALAPQAAHSIQNKSYVPLHYGALLLVNGVWLSYHPQVKAERDRREYWLRPTNPSLINTGTRSADNSLSLATTSRGGTAHDDRHIELETSPHSQTNNARTTAPGSSNDVFEGAGRTLFLLANGFYAGSFARF